MNFLPCVLYPTEKDFLKNIGAKPGYYLLRFERDSDYWGGKNTPIHATRYGLMKVFQGANSLLATCDGTFIQNLSKTETITGYCELGLDDEVVPLT